MHSFSPYLRDVGWIGLAIGITVTILGSMAGGGVGSLAQGYGVVGVAAAGFLLGGLWLRDSIKARRAAPRHTTRSAEILHA